MKRCATHCVIFRCEIFSVAIDLVFCYIEREKVAWHTHTRIKTYVNCYIDTMTQNWLCSSSGSCWDRWKSEFMRDEGPPSVIITVISVDERNSNWLNALVTALHWSSYIALHKTECWRTFNFAGSKCFEECYSLASSSLSLLTAMLREQNIAHIELQIPKHDRHIHCQCVFFSLSILNVSHCYVFWYINGNLEQKNNQRFIGDALIGLNMMNEKKPITIFAIAKHTEKCHYIHKQVKCMLRLLCYASIAAWYCFNVSVAFFCLFVNFDSLLLTVRFICSLDETRKEATHLTNGTFEYEK